MYGLFLEMFNLFENFSTVSARAVIFHVSISCDKIFVHVLVSWYLSLGPWQSLELAIIGSICVSPTHLVYIDFVHVLEIYFHRSDNFDKISHFDIKHK